MLWENFLESHQFELHKMWLEWIPSKSKSKNSKKTKIYYLNNPEYRWDYRMTFDDEYMERFFDPDIPEFIELVDKGDRVTSFEHFVCCAYENSIP